MAITLTTFDVGGGNPVVHPLPDDLVFQDEYIYDTVKSQYTRSLSGRNVIEQQLAIKGRTITMKGSKSQGWINRIDLDILKGVANVSMNPMALQLHDGTVYTVMFDRSKKSVDAQPIFNRSEYRAESQFYVTLNFLEV